jgi:nucleoside-diphosphate-sugar epimerase
VESQCSGQTGTEILRCAQDDKGRAEDDKGRAQGDKARERDDEGGRVVSGGVRVYNIATGVGTSLEALARLVCRVVGSDSRVVPATERSPEGDRVADLTCARTELGYAPSVDVEEGVRRMADSVAAEPERWRSDR